MGKARLTWKHTARNCKEGALTMAKRVYSTFADFYPFYLSEHTHPVCRRLHVTGSSLVVLLVSYAVLTATWMALLLVCRWWAMDLPGQATSFLRKTGRPRSPTPCSASWGTE